MDSAHSCHKLPRGGSETDSKEKWRSETLRRRVSADIWANRRDVGSKYSGRILKSFVKDETSAVSFVVISEEEEYLWQKQFLCNFVQFLSLKIDKNFEST